MDHGVRAGAGTTSSSPTRSPGSCRCSGRRLSAGATGVATPGTPVIGVAATWAQGERPSAGEAAGMALIIGALAIVAARGWSPAGESCRRRRTAGGGGRSRARPPASQAAWASPGSLVEEDKYSSARRARPIRHLSDISRMIGSISRICSSVSAYTSMATAPLSRSTSSSILRGQPGEPRRNLRASLAPPRRLEVAANPRALLLDLGGGPALEPSDPNEHRTPPCHVMR